MVADSHYFEPYFEQDIEFSTTVQTQEDGTVKAFSPQHPRVEPVIRGDHAEAVLALQERMYRYFASGGRVTR